MTTSGNVSWNLDVANLVEVAARRAFPSDEKGMLSAIDAKNARSCLNMVLTDLTNAGHTLNKLEFKTLTVTKGLQTYPLPNDVVDIFDVTFAKDNGSSNTPRYTETPLTRIDLANYNQINNKTTESLISQFALHRGKDNVTMYVYPTSEDSTSELRYWALTRIEDVDAANQDVDLNYRYTNSLISGISYYMCLEKPSDSPAYEPRLARLKKGYADDVDLAFGEDRDRASAFIRPSLRRY